MIRITLTPDDAVALDVPQVIEYDALRPRVKVLRALDQQVGMTLAELGEKLNSSDLLARSVVVWLALRHMGNPISWEDFDLDILGTDFESVDVDPKEVPSTS